MAVVQAIFFGKARGLEALLDRPLPFARGVPISNISAPPGGTVGTGIGVGAGGGAGGGC